MNRVSYSVLLMAVVLVGAWGLTQSHRMTAVQADDATVQNTKTERVAETAQTPLGRTIPDFKLKDVNGRTFSLADVDKQKFVVLVFMGTECPLAKLYGPRLEELSQRFKDRGVIFWGVNSNTQDSLTETSAYVKRHGVTFPMLKDVGNRVADTCGAVRTPEAFILDGDRRVRYWGRIDDQYGIGIAHEKPKHEFLAVALEQLLEGKDVTEPVVAAVGCHIGRIQEPKANATVTWSNQISRLFQKRCVECHRAGEIGPFELTEYEEVVGWADMIREVVDEDRMPPWHADPAHGKFLNDRRLTAGEKQLIDRWVQDGAPEGDPSQLPPPLPDRVTGWQLPREPDQIVELDDEISVPASGEVKYLYREVDPGFTEDMWIQAAEVVPGNREVVHHILVLVRPPRTGTLSALAKSEWLAGYVPGLRVQPYPQGMAKLVPAGSKLVFQLHYTPNGSPQTDLSKIGLIFAKREDVTHAILTTKAATNRFRIPPHDDSYRIEAKSSRTPVDVQLLAMMPHMHLRGKSFSYELEQADGSRSMLLNVPAYDFNWQTAYRLAKPLPISAGARVHCVAHFDNSTGNLANPDPEQTVRWGDQTWDEMMIGYFDIAVPLTAAGKPDPAVANAKVKAVLNRFDKNKDGVIQKSETPLLLRGKFRQLDKDKDDKVTPAELQDGIKLLGD